MTEALKDSKVSWLGEIPESWSIDRTKFHYLNLKQVAGVKSKDYERLALTLNGVIKRPKDDTDGLQPGDFNGYQILRSGDLVFKLIDLQNVSTSRVGLAHDTGIVSPAYIRLEPRKNDSSRYGEYYFLSMWQREIFNQLGDAGVRSNLSSTDLLELPYIKLPYEDQIKIADFLDEKCAEIDHLSEDIQKQIDILEEYKKSVITRAVTKGLDPNTEMKDSGIQWVGMMPKNWKLPKILYCLEMPITDGPHTTPELFDDGVPFVSAEAVSTGDGKINFDNIRGFISEKFYKECCKKYIPKIDDIYMIKSGATTGKIAIVDTDKKFTIWSPLAVFRVNKDIVTPKYMYYSLYSDYIQRQVETGWTYGTQQNIGMRSLEKMKLCIPSIDEQNKIVEFLDKIYSEANDTIRAYRDQLQKLETYKKSIIYEYVTGKKRVA